MHFPTLDTWILKPALNKEIINLMKTIQKRTTFRSHWAESVQSVSLVSWFWNFIFIRWDE